MTLPERIMESIIDIKPLIETETDENTKETLISCRRDQEDVLLERHKILTIGHGVEFLDINAMK